MSDVNNFVEDALQASTLAIQFDTKGNQEAAAAYYYRAAASCLEKAAQNTDNSQNSAAWLEKINEYRSRATKLEAVHDSRHQSVSQNDNDKILSKIYFLFTQGLDADEAGSKEEAIEFYSQAVEICLTFKGDDTETKSKISKVANKALTRAEELKGITATMDDVVDDISKMSVQPGSSNQTQQTVNVKNVRPALHRGSSAHLQVTGGQETYTEEEKHVLLTTSYINAREYVPFMAVDLSEKFQFAISFTDKSGPLQLAPKQKRSFVKWVRPDEICLEPKMISGTFVDCFSIKQTVISDCSFVASLAVSALYEKRFGRHLITSIIYPQNRNREPVYNPYGKYMIKLHLNGVPRKVIIDDLLPLGRDNRLLCSYSSKRDEFWVSFLEKAYMKVMGGYDFPGSNSNIDLHALTGWIPERIAISTNTEVFNANSFFDMLESRLAKGDVLVTVATGDLSDAEADRTGLVSTHAYAVFDVKNVDGLRLLLIKNPWSHLRWKGNYSELDTQNWTPELKLRLNYDPKSAAQFDNGVFWIDYASVLRFFDVFYLNWNPELFNHTYAIHQSWNAHTGPIKDAYTIGDNPQFSLEVESSTGAIWILLTRHITQIEDFKENREYITVLVYKNNGHRVYYPYDPSPYIDGIKINSPHYLCKIILSPSAPKKYTLVVSQYEKMNTINYTLRAYATCPFVLTKISNPYEYVKELTEEWNDETAGGCRNHSTFGINPRFRVNLEGPRNDNKIYLELKGPKQYSVGMDITITKVNDEDITAPFNTKSTGSYRSGFVYIELEDIPAGSLDVIPSTYLPGQKSPFFLKIKSSCKFNLAKVQ